MIHCIGDSHSAVFSGKEEMQPIWPIRSDDKLPFFRSYRIGPATAYQLETKVGIITSVLNSVVNKTDDRVLFCFGEVDIRAHLIKQMELQKKSINEVVKECVDRYIKVVLLFRDMGYNVMTWGPIASWHESKEYTGGPSFGTCLERNNVTKEFNRQLKEHCDLYNVGFISIFENMVDENNITKPEYLDDWDGCHMHLSQRAMPIIIEEFNKQKLI
jgi:hypothetical protein